MIRSTTKLLDFMNLATNCGPLSNISGGFKSSWIQAGHPCLARLIICSELGQFEWLEQDQSYLHVGTMLPW